MQRVQRHMAIRTIIMGLFLTFLPMITPAADRLADSAQTDLKSKVSQLIEQLNAETRKQRALAQKELLRLGPGVLPLLPPPELTPNAEVRDAVGRIRGALERRQALDSVRPSRITFEGTVAVDEFLRAISQQTGNRLDFARLPVETQRLRLTTAYKQQPFWEVIDDLGGRANLTYDRQSVSDRLKLISSQDADQTAEIAVAYSGPFRIAVTSARLRGAANIDSVRIARLNYQLTAEPRLRPLFLKYRGRDFSAASATGHRFGPFSPDARLEIPLGEGGRQLTLHSDFKVPATLKPQTINFRGRMTMTTAAGTERIIFTRLRQAQGVARRRGGVTLKLQQVSFQGGPDEGWQARIRVAVSYDTGGRAFESHRTWVFHNHVYLLAKDGRRVKRDSAFHTALERDGAVSVEYKFRNLGGDLDNYRFVYVAPTLIVDVPIEFNIKNIPVSQTSPERKQP